MFRIHRAKLDLLLATPEHRGTTAACSGGPGAMVHGSTSEGHVSCRQHMFRLLSLAARLRAVTPHAGQENRGSPSQARLPSASVRNPATICTRRWIVQNALSVPMRYLIDPSPWDEERNMAPPATAKTSRAARAFPLPPPVLHR
jgi:hypothetical protein